MKKITFSILIILIILAATFFTINKPKQETIKIGFIGPLTGEAANLGMPVRNAFDLAIKEANKIGKNKFEVIYEDGKCTSKEAVTAAQKLIDVDNVEILATVCSSETLSVAPLSEKKKIILLSLGTSPDISKSGDYVFRNSYSDEDTSKKMATTIFQKAKKVGVIYEITSYPVGLKDAFRKYFENMNGTVTEEGYAQNTKDVRTQLTKIISQNPDAILVDPDTTSTGISVLIQLKELGFTGFLYGNYFGGGSDVIKTPEAEGLIFFSDPTVKESDKKSKMFEKYKESYGKYPEFEYWSSASYDTANAIIQAMKNEGDKTEDIKSYLYQNNFTGILGSYSFDKNGDMISIEPSISQIKNMTLVNIE